MGGMSEIFLKRGWGRQTSLYNPPLYPSNMSFKILINLFWLLVTVYNDLSKVLYCVCAGNICVLLLLSLFNVVLTKITGYFNYPKLRIILRRKKTAQTNSNTGWYLWIAKDAWNNSFWTRKRGVLWLCWSIIAKF